MIKNNEWIKEPIIKEPIIKGYQHHAYPLSIMSSHKHFDNWFCNHYIQLKCNRADTELHFDFCGYIFVQHQHPFLRVQRISRNIASTGFKSIGSFVDSALSLGYCVYLFLDEYYIAEKRAFKKNHFIHDSLITGQLTEQDGYIMRGYTNKSTYSELSISSENLLQAFQAVPDHVEDWQSYIYVIHVDPTATYSFNMDLFVEEVKGYYLSIPYNIKLSSFYNLDPLNTIFGIKAQSYLINYIEQTNGFLDIRPFHIIWEHKLSMDYRLSFLIKNNYLKGEMIEKLDYKMFAHKALI
ncbi:hypothetical protein ACFOQM_00005, partial [Paenibacillus sp. GCM10012307]